jgi:hypothetical protein
LRIYQTKYRGCTKYDHREGDSEVHGDLQLVGITRIRENRTPLREWRIDGLSCMGRP